MGLKGELTTAFHHQIELGRSHQHPVRRRAPSPLPIVLLAWASGGPLAVLSDIGLVFAEAMKLAFECRTG